MIADIAYQVQPKTKQQPFQDFLTLSDTWLVWMPPQSANMLRALAEEFEQTGTEGLNNRELFVQRIKNASCGSPFKALGLVSKPIEIFKEFKKRFLRSTLKFYDLSHY